MSAQGGTSVQRIRRDGGVMLIAVALAAMALVAVEIAPAVGAPPVKACQLVTAKDVADVFGGGYTQTEANEITCAYTASGRGLTVNLLGTLSDAASTLTAAQAGFKQQGRTVGPVSGLGEGAYYLAIPRSDSSQPSATVSLGTIAFGKGQLIVQLAMTEDAPSVDFPALLKLAKIAYPRLP